MHTQTASALGRPAQLLGPWAIDAEAYEQLYEQAAQIINGGQYEVVARESREMAQQDIREPYERDADGVAHMAVNGLMTRTPTSLQSVLGGTSTMLLQRAIRMAASDPSVKGMMLHINSPGGTADGMEDVSREIASFRQTKPVMAHIAHVGASAAYRLAVEADHISMDAMGMVGSVGTLSQIKDTSKLMERAGVKNHYIRSGDRKATPQAGEGVTAEHIADRQKLVDEINQVFLGAVRTRRPNITPDNMNDVQRAGIYGAQSALKMGLIDSIADTSSAIERFKQNLSTGNRSLSAASPPPAAAQPRSVTMLTTEQLTQAKALPGCADITAENADGKLLAAAIGLQTNYDVKANAVASLERQLAEAKIDKAAQTNPAVLKAMASASRIHLKDAVAKQAITPAVGEALASSLIGTDENLSAAGLTPSASGECFATMVFSALAQNGAAPNVGKQAGAQPAPKATPGAPEEGPVSAERQAQLLGQTPLGMSVASAK